MRHYIQGLGVALAIIVAAAGSFGGFSGTARAEILGTEAALADRSLGDPNAPVTIIEYSSLGCSHCKAFHTETLPVLQKEYIDTGKVRLIYRDFPLGNRAMAAAMIARCAPAERYFGMVKLFFAKQSDWSQSEDAIGALSKVAKFGGLSGTDVSACLQNQALIDGLRARAETGQEEHGVESTPTFFIVNNGEVIKGSLPADAFRERIEAALN